MPSIKLLAAGTGSASGVISTSPGNHIHKLVARNPDNAMLFCLFFDSPTVPQAGAQAIGQVFTGIGVTADSTENERPLSPDYLVCSTGLSYGWSTTDFIYTPIGGAVSTTGLGYEVWGN